jgi:hypothetical protein|tara:strand:- start:1559 stop:1801 length:243 start_codon:yes stop_codon:yes gene_type:complete
MNRKFVKENKQVLREFIGKLLVSLITKKNKRALDKAIEADPALKKNRQEMDKLTKDIRDRINKLQKTNPEIAKNLRKAYL